MSQPPSLPSTHLSIRPDWLALQQEAIIEPDLPIVDAHHHLWDHPGNRYFLHDLLGDIGSGHNVWATVAVECGAMYRKDAPSAMRPVGETEFLREELLRMMQLRGMPRIADIGPDLVNRDSRQAPRRVAVAFPLRSRLRRTAPAPCSAPSQFVMDWSSL